MRRVAADDPALVLGAQQGDRGALDTLLRRHHDRLHLLSRRLMGNEADALDATQEALISIARGIRSFDGRSAFSTWAYRVTTNACLDELRRRRRRPVVGRDADVASVAERPSPDRDLERLPERAAIDAALDQVSPEFRASVVLRDLCDLDYAEIASILDLPPGTVRSRIARGRAQLAVLLEPRNQPTDPGRQAPRTDTEAHP